MITVHEVTPGHYAHGRALRALTSDARRCLESPAFVEGWAHYSEELYAEEAFGEGDPALRDRNGRRGAAATRLICAIGLHTGGMTVAEAADRFAANVRGSVRG